MKSEIEYIELKERVKKAEEEQDSQETYFITVVSSFITCAVLAIFIWYKRILDEYWYYGVGLFASLALISLILSFFAYKWEKQAKEKLKKLKKQEKELKESAL